MKQVYAISVRSYDIPLIAICTNLKEVYKVLCRAMPGELVPTYSKITTDFRNRKKYSRLICSYSLNEEEYIEVDVEWIELNTI